MFAETELDEEDSFTLSMSRSDTLCERRCSDVDTFFASDSAGVLVDCRPGTVLGNMRGRFVVGGLDFSSLLLLLLQ